MAPSLSCPLLVTGQRERTRAAEQEAGVVVTHGHQVLLSVGDHTVVGELHTTTLMQ